MVSLRVAAVAAVVLMWPGAHSVAQRASAPRLVSPNGLALDGQGNLFISDISTHQIVKLASGRLTVVAGTGDGAFHGDGGPATAAQLFAPHGLAFDREGRLLIADTFNHRIRRIDRAGVITTIAGTGSAGYSGDSGPAASAALNGPQDVAVDAAGNIFIADTYNAVVRRLDRQGIITTVAGSEPGLGGDGGAATKALLNMPSAIAIAADGVLYISDAANSRVRRVATDGTIQTIAGSGLGSGIGGAGYGGDEGPVEKSRLFSAMGLHVDANGDLYIADTGNHRVRAVRAGAIATIAGSTLHGFAGDGGAAVMARLNAPQKIVSATDGRVYVSDRANGRVRMIDAAGVIRTVAGDGPPGGVVRPRR